MPFVLLVITRERKSHDHYATGNTTDIVAQASTNANVTRRLANSAIPPPFAAVTADHLAA
jgi:hypothetical protein